MMFKKHAISQNKNYFVYLYICKIEWYMCYVNNKDIPFYYIFIPYVDVYDKGPDVKYLS